MMFSVLVVFSLVVSFLCIVLVMGWVVFSFLILDVMCCVIL